MRGVSILSLFALSLCVGICTLPFRCLHAPFPVACTFSFCRLHVHFPLSAHSPFSCLHIFCPLFARSFSRCQRTPYSVAWIFPVRCSHAISPLPALLCPLHEHFHFVAYTAIFSPLIVRSCFLYLHAFFEFIFCTLFPVYMY